MYSNFVVILSYIVPTYSMMGVDDYNVLLYWVLYGYTSRERDGRERDGREREMGEREMGEREREREVAITVAADGPVLSCTREGVNDGLALMCITPTHI
jgi:hypothetical protein